MKHKTFVADLKTANYIWYKISNSYFLYATGLYVTDSIYTLTDD